MRLKRLTIRNYRMFQKLTIDNLGPVAFFIGPNGSGKSTLLELIAFLQDAAYYGAEYALAAHPHFAETLGETATGPCVFEAEFVGPNAGVQGYAVELIAHEGHAQVGFQRHSGEAFEDAPDPAMAVAQGVASPAALAKRLHGLWAEHRDAYDAVVAAMSLWVPGIEGVKAQAGIGETMDLWFKERAFADPIHMRHISDGTLRIVAYLVHLLDPAARSISCLDIPETHIHPRVLPELVALFREGAAHGGQVLVATQAPALLNAASIDEVFWLDKRHGATVVQRAADDGLVHALVAEGETLGSLWLQGYVGGRF